MQHNMMFILKVQKELEKIMKEEKKLKEEIEKKRKQEEDKKKHVWFVFIKIYECII